jgi:hypothetical protein
MLKRFVTNPLLSALVVAAVSLPGGLAVGATAQEEAIRPSLADLMALTQLRQFKLWYAERVRNWKLSAYELDQFQATIDRTQKLYPTASSIAQAALIKENSEPAMRDLRRAISEGNNSLFENAFTRITQSCNQCHEAAGVGFIVVRVPTSSLLAISKSIRRGNFEGLEALSGLPDSASQRENSRSALAAWPMARSRTSPAITVIGITGQMHICLSTEFEEAETGQRTRH